MNLVNIPSIGSAAHPIVKEGVHGRQEDGRMNIHEQLRWDAERCRDGRRDRLRQDHIPDVRFRGPSFEDECQVSIRRCCVEI